MIWVGGEIVEDHELKISVMDRAFEHGLGLFETFRTWNGRPLLLDRHLARMQASARKLELPLDARDLPDVAAVARLDAAENTSGDRMFRITMTGGAPGHRPVVWLRGSPLPPATPATGVRVRLDRIAYQPLALHKSLNYWSRRLSYESALGRGYDEAVQATDDDLVWSGSRTNLFAGCAGILLTPPLLGPLVPGIMRGLVLERAARLGIETREENLSLDGLRDASEIFLTNSVRGILPIAAFDGRELSRARPDHV